MTYRKKIKSPLISKEMLTDKKIEIARMNKERAKSMERKIAKYLKGRRQPGSGSMSPFKGDCFIPLIHHKGNYLIECKLSSSMHKDKYHRIRVVLSWFPKLERDRTAMECLFGVLIIHFYNQVNDYVFWSVKDIWRLKKWFSEERITFFKEVLELPISFDMTVRQNGTERKGYQLLKHQLDSKMMSVQNIRVAKARSIDNDYIILRIEDFRDIVMEL